MGTGIRTGHHEAWRQDRAHGMPASPGAPGLGWGPAPAGWGAPRALGALGQGCVSPPVMRAGRPGLQSDLSKPGAQNEAGAWVDSRLGPPSLGTPSLCLLRIGSRGRQARPLPRPFLTLGRSSGMLAVLYQPLCTFPAARKVHGGLPSGKRTFRPRQEPKAREGAAAGLGSASRGRRA